MVNDIINLLLGGAIGTILGCGVVILHHFYLIRQDNKQAAQERQALMEEGNPWEVNGQ